MTVEMRIKLICDLPIDHSHEAFKDNIYPVVRFEEGTNVGDKYWFRSKSGELCAALDGEVEVIDE